MVETLGLEIVAKENIVLYPNPSEGYIWIKSEQFEGNAIQVRLMDLHGRLIWKQIISNQSQPMGFDLSDTQPGMYILAIQAKNILWQSKILLTR